MVVSAYRIAKKDVDRNERSHPGMLCFLKLYVSLVSFPHANLTVAPSIHQYISDLRACRVRELEEKRINREMAHIRQKFKGKSPNFGCHKPLKIALY